MPRLFFALTVPPSISDSLDELTEGIPRARWALDNDYHITLSFLGEVPHHRLDEVIDVAEGLRGSTFELSLQSAGVFPHRGQPRVLWIGLKKEERLIALQRSLHQSLLGAEFPLERRKYHPHITLARIDRAPREPVFDWLGHHLGYESKPFLVHRFHLFSSVLTPQGSRYTIERSFGLIPAAKTPTVRDWT